VGPRAAPRGARVELTSALRYPGRDIGAHPELLQDGRDEPAYAKRKVLDRRDAMRGRSRAQSSAC